MYDIVIVGAGPAGVSAGVYAQSRGCKTLVLEQKEIGGLIGSVSSVTHYAGIVEGESGASFAARLRRQADEAGFDLAFEQVEAVSLHGDVKTVKTGAGEYRARSLILANGTTPRSLAIPGEQKLAGVGCGLNAARDAERFRGKGCYVVGGADGAVKEALYLARFAKKVTIVCVEDGLVCIDEFQRKVAQTPTIAVLPSSSIAALRGEGRIEQLDVASTSGGEMLSIDDPGCGVFVYAGSTPNTALFSELALQDGYIVTNERMETSLPGVYAAGDVRAKQVRQVATAVSDGAVAAVNAAAR